jgi:hypothetical protein
MFGQCQELNARFFGSDLVRLPKRFSRFFLVNLWARYPVVRHAAHPVYDMGQTMHEPGSGFLKKSKAVELVSE